MEHLKIVIFNIYNFLLYSTDDSDIFSPYDEILSPEISRQPISTRQHIFASNHRSTNELFDSLEEKGFLQVEKDININQLKINFEEKLTKKLSSITMYKDTDSILQTLLNEQVSLGVISNIPTVYLGPFFQYKLDKYFEHLIFSCDVGMTKPFEEIYRLITYKSFLPFQSMMMVEQENNESLQMAKSLGMQTLVWKRNYTNRVSYVHLYLKNLPVFLPENA